MQCMALSVIPSVKVRSNVAGSKWDGATNCSISLMIFCNGSARAKARSVGIMPRAERTNSGSSSLWRSRFNIPLTAGCVSAKRSAARVTLRSSSKTCKALSKLKLVYFAESLGGVETLLTYPIEQTHAEAPKELLARVGVDDRLLRLSVGIEDVEDLKEDLEQALAE